MVHERWFQRGKGEITMYVYREEKSTLKIQLNVTCTLGNLLMERLIKHGSKVEFK